MKELLSAILRARIEIANTKEKKQGRNNYSNYDYFTPAQISNLVLRAEQNNGLVHFFELLKDNLGELGKMTIYHIESGQSKELIQRTAIPTITETNVTQQIGGCVTFTERYMLMSLFTISDNNLDFDAEKPKTPQKIIWLTETQFKKAIKSDQKGIKRTLEIYNSETKKMKKEYKEELEKQLKTLKL